MKNPTRNVNKLLAKAIRIASVAFENVLDRGDVPYVLHCLHVMNAMPKNDAELKIIAVLHDLIEDTEWSFSDLRSEGFSPRVINTLDLLTHRENEEYERYIERLSVSPDATLVKLADLRHNSDIHRMKGLRDKDIAILAKYHKAYDFLKNK